MAAKRKYKRKSKSKKPGDNRVRTLVECSPHRTTGGGFIPKLMAFDVEHESPPERKTLAMLCLCHDVRFIASQATEEPYFYDGRPCHHIPDFTLNTFVDGLRIEVKALASLVHGESLDKYAAVGKSYQERGIPFALLVDAQLEEEPRFSSVKLLFRYSTGKMPDAALAEARVLLENGPLAIPELIARGSLKLVDVWTLIAQRHICFDWKTRLNSKTTIVSLPEQPFGGLKLEDILRSTRFGDFLAELALGRRPTDQCILADAKAWRQSYRPPSPWSVVGGFKRAEPLRDLREEESAPRAVGRRRDYAPGFRSVAPSRSH